MKTRLLLFIIPLTSVITAQTTLTLQPGPEGKDAKVFNIGASANYGDDPEFIASTLYYNEEPGTQRSMIEFDLSSIPPTAGILDARLSLYHNPTSPSEGHVGENASYLRRIIEDWNESTVDWTSQPAYSLINQVYIPTSTSPNQHYENIDVAPLIRDMIANPSQSHGFMFMGTAEAVPSSMKFYSGDATEATLRPRLVVTYITNPVDCITIQPGNEGKDAKVFSEQDESNFGGDPDFIASAWTFGGNDEVLRSFIDFDLDPLPANATITSAELSLYYNDMSASEGHAGDNTAILQRITSPWVENTISWGNQPATTTQNQVILPASTSTTQDYENINVTQLVRDIVNNPSSSYGIMFRLQTEEVFRSMKFASSDFPEADKRPKLEICYTLGTATNELPVLSLSVNPNPFTDQLVLYDLEGELEIVICDLLGKQYFARKIIADKQPVILSEANRLLPGVYIVSATSKKARFVSQIAKVE